MAVTFEKFAKQTRWWRLSNNVYACIPKQLGEEQRVGYQGEGVFFVPNRAQSEFLAHLHTRNHVPKARQLGMSTVNDLLGLDGCLFNANYHMGIIAETEDLAKIFLRDKIRFAYDRLHPAIRSEVRILSDNKTEVRFSNGSAVHVGVTMRGRTLDFLHVSERGKICAKNPEHAEEIKTGSFEAVKPDGIIIDESTAMGRSGDFYEDCMDARRREETGLPLTHQDWRLHFLPWWYDESYQLDIDIESERLTTYFKELEQRDSIKLNRRQKNWYVQREGRLRRNMKQEYPSTFDEAFEKTIEGAIFGQEMLRARHGDEHQPARIDVFPFIRGLPVNTFWDIGRRDPTSIWFHQSQNGWDTFVRYYEHRFETVLHYVQFLRTLEAEQGYLWGIHYLPHDAAHLRPESVAGSFSDLMESHGFRTEVLTVVPDKLYVIELARQAFDHSRFNAAACEDGIKALDEYQWKYSRTEASFTNRPRPNKACHAADAFQTFALAKERFNLRAGPGMGIGGRRRGLSAAEQDRRALSGEGYRSRGRAIV